MKLNKNKVKKDDGRNLIFYTFEDESENKNKKQKNEKDSGGEN